MYSFGWHNGVIIGNAWRDVILSAAERALCVSELVLLADRSARLPAKLARPAVRLECSQWARIESSRKTEDWFTRSDS